MSAYLLRHPARLLLPLLVVALLAGLCAAVLEAQAPSTSPQAVGNLPPLGGINPASPAVDPPATPDATRPSTRLALRPLRPKLMADCQNYVTNSEMTYLNDWEAVDDNVYWYAGAYASAPHSAIMVDGYDADLVYDDSPESDGLGQALSFPNLNVTSVTVEYYVAFGASDDYDNLYYSLYTLDTDGHLDVEVTRWGPVSDAEDSQWHARSGELTTPASIAALQGRNVALVFWTATDNLAPYEVAYLDDIELVICTETPPTNAPTRTLQPTATQTTPPGTTPSPTPTLPAGELIRDGGFESGTFSNWRTGGQPAIDSAIKRSGNYATRLGGRADTLDWIDQVVTIPSDATQVTLSMWQRTVTEEEWYGYDYCCVTFWDQDGEVVWQACYDAGQGGHDWYQMVHNFSASELATLHGQTIFLEVAVENDFSLLTTVWVDDISLVTDAGTAPPTPHPTTRPTTAMEPDLFPSDISSNKSIVAPGESIDYTITLQNQGTSTANQVVMTSTLPNHTTFASWITPGGAAHSGNIVTWSGDLAAGAQHIISYRAQVSASAPSGSSLVNRLTFSDASGRAYPERQASTSASTQTDYKTLIVTHGGRLASLYSAGERDNVLHALNSTLAPHAQVSGLVVDLATEGSVADEYNAWLASASNANANQVCDAIWHVIDNRLTQNPSIEYVVLVGNDLVIPLRRVRDGTRDEANYPYNIVGSQYSAGNITELALNEGNVLSDDYYVDRNPTTPPGWDHALYLPDLAIGRLIEMPAEIIGTIDAFVADHAVNLDAGIITGQAIAPNGQRMGNATANEICRIYRNAGTSMDCSEIATKARPDTATINKVLKTRRDVRVMIEHADHYNVGIDAQSDVATASASDLARSLFYSVGCHAGLNVPDTDSPGAHPLDLAQAFAQKGVAFFSNTGYGLGLIGGQIGLTERLLLCLSEQLTQGSTATIGKAIVAAKQDYWSHYQYGDAADEKVLVQTVLYGLPMTQVSRPGLSQIEAARQPASSPGLQSLTVNLAASGGLAKQRVTFFDYTLTLSATQEGSYYYFGNPISGILACPGYPTQPRFYQEFTLQGTQAHGAAFYSASYSDQASFQAFIPRLALPALNLPENMREQEVPFRDMSWYPSVPRMFSRAGTESPATLLLAAGQYHQGSRKERLYDEMAVNIYYSNSDDWAPPVINGVQVNMQQSMAAFSVQAVDPGSGIEQVLLAYTDGKGQWKSISLKQEPDGRWSGRLPASSGLDYFVQAVDKAGNVAVDDNLGHYYLVGNGTGDSGWRLGLPVIIR